MRLKDHTRLRVLQVVGNMEAGGGIETWLMDVLRLIDRDRFEVDLCYISGSPGSLCPEIERMGYRMIRCDMPYRLIDFVGPFYKLLKSGTYDIVHVHLMDFSGPALLLAEHGGVPVRIAHYHNTDHGYQSTILRDLYMKLLHYWTARYGNYFWGCSRDALAAFYGDLVDSDSCYRVMPYGIKLDKFRDRGLRSEVRRELGIPEDAAVIGHVGRFVEQKNHHAFVKLASLLEAQGLRPYFVFIGDGELRPEIAAQAARAGFAERFIFTGLTDDVGRLLSAMDLFVFPSFWEGFGIVLIEAQAAGLPVIATDLPAHRESVAPGMHEFFFQPEQIKKAASHILRLLGDKELYRVYSRDAIEFAEGFSIEASVRGVEDAYLRILTERKY